MVDGLRRWLRVWLAALLTLAALHGPQARRHDVIGGVPICSAAAYDHPPRNTPIAPDRQHACCLLACAADLWLPTSPTPHSHPGHARMIRRTQRASARPRGPTSRRAFAARAPPDGPV